MKSELPSLDLVYSFCRDDIAFKIFFMYTFFAETNRATLEKSHLTMGLHLFTEKVFKGKLTKFWSMVYKNRVIRETIVIYS